jgi:hypothetical protein
VVLPRCARWCLAHDLRRFWAVVYLVARQLCGREAKVGFARFVSQFSFGGRLRGLGLLVGVVAFALGGLNLGAVPYLASLQTTTNSTPDIQAATLVWNPSPDPAASGYFVCWGYAADQCTNRLDVGNATSASVAGLSLDLVYWFEVVAYDGTGRQAVPSNEISYQRSVAARPAATPTLSLGVAQSGRGTVAQLSFQGQAGAAYEVQATTDFHHWESILTTNSPAAGLVLIQSQDMSLYPRRFYRLVLLPASSLPALPTLSLTLNSSGTAGAVLRLSFQATAGSTYDIQATPDFQQWSLIGTTNCSASGVVTYNVAPPTNTPRQFFRLAVR